jgi:hypothetical protein
MSDIVFRRIHGRVIPIRKSKGKSAKDRNIVKGAAIVGAGVAVGVAAGAVSAGLLREAATFENVSRGVKAVWRSGLKDKAIATKTLARTFRVAAKNRLEAKRFALASMRVQKYGAIASAALIGAGVHQGLKKTKLSDKEKAGVATASGVGAHFSIRSAFHYFLQPKGPNLETGVKATRSISTAFAHAAKRIAARGLKL